MNVRPLEEIQQRMDATQFALIGIAAVFGGYLLVQVRPAFSPRGRALLAEVRAARKRATDAGSPALQALALTDGGGAAARAKRWVAAAGLFLRALRADPAAVDLVSRMVKALDHRPRLLASILERRMGALSEASAERPAFIAMARALEQLYAGPLRRRFQAKLVSRLIRHEEMALTHDADSAEPSP